MQRKSKISGDKKEGRGAGFLGEVTIEGQNGAGREEKSENRKIFVRVSLLFSRREIGMLKWKKENRGPDGRETGGIRHDRSAERDQDL